MSDEEKLRGLMEIACRSGALYVAVDIYERMPEALRAELAEGGVRVWPHPLMEAGTIAAVMPPDPFDWLRTPPRR